MRTTIALEIASGAQLPKIPGVSTVTASRILPRTGNPSRFPNESEFANYTGT
ncbi:transposase [Rhodococcus sp. ACT016]|uniref:transposase n=1 Tax=Rhodococcus sp. ACT016 TaxID=3134808 RepID=UPI003D29C7A0